MSGRGTPCHPLDTRPSQQQRLWCYKPTRTPGMTSSVTRPRLCTSCGQVSYDSACIFSLLAPALLLHTSRIVSSYLPSSACLPHMHMHRRCGTMSQRRGAAQRRSRPNKAREQKAHQHLDRSCSERSMPSSTTITSQHTVSPAPIRAFSRMPRQCIRSREKSSPPASVPITTRTGRV